MSHRFEIKRAIKALERTYDAWKACPPPLDSRDARAVYFVYVAAHLIRFGLEELPLDDVIREIAVHMSKVIHKGEYTRSPNRRATRQRIIEEMFPFAVEFLETAKRLASESSHSRFVLPETNVIEAA